MRVIELEQNTPEWEHFREGKSGGSAFGKLFKVGGKLPEKLPDQFFKMLAERVARPMTPNDYLDRVPEGVAFSWAVRGQILEEDAAKAFSTRYNKPLVKNQVWVSKYSQDAYISPDRAIVGQNGTIDEAVEIKCLSSDKMLRVWYEQENIEADQAEFDLIPSNDYKAQVLKYFMVNDDLKTLYWVMYTDLIPALDLVVLTIKREDVEQYLEQARLYELELLAELIDAEEMLDTKLNNEKGESDYEEDRLG